MNIKFDKKFKEVCGKDYFPSIIPNNSSRIIALGDIHGDLELVINMLKISKVIKIKEEFNKNFYEMEANEIAKKIEWIGNKTYVVQVGDQVDRCRPYSLNSDKKCADEGYVKNDEGSDLKIMLLMNLIHEKAVKKGGMVISLLGNHELMNVKGDMGYVSYKGFEEFNNYFNKVGNNFEQTRRDVFSPGNEISKMLGCTRHASVIIGEFLFVHAGIIKKFVNKNKIKEENDLEVINKNIKLWLLGLITEDNIDQIINSTKDSMFWTRVLGNIPPGISVDSEECSQLPLFEMFEASPNMVIGHTPQSFTHTHDINSTCGNRLWRVDNGSSKAFDVFPESESDGVKESREIQALEIIKENEEFEYYLLSEKDKKKWNKSQYVWE